MTNLFDYIDRPTFEAACARLGTTADEFTRMSGDQIRELFDGYMSECATYITRLHARDDQVRAAARITATVPAEHRHRPLYDLAQSGIIDAEEFQRAVRTLAEVQARDELDPNPHDDNVVALLDAMACALRAKGEPG